jgi:WD40 repeat protein
MNISRRARTTFVLIAAALLSAVAFPKPLEDGRLRLVPLLTDGFILDIQESPDGTRLLTHDRGYAPRLWDARSMRILGFLSHNTREVAQAEMSEKGNLVVTNSYDEVKIWNAKTARLLTTFNNNGDKDFGANRFAISSDERTIVLSQESGLWLGYAPDFKFKKILDFPEEFFAYDVQFSPDNTKLAIAAGSQSKLGTYDLTTKKLNFYSVDSDGNIFVEFSPDSKQLLVTGISNKAHLVDFSTGKLLGQYPHFIGERGRYGNVQMAALFVGPSLSQFVTCGETGTMTIYDRTTLKVVRELKGYRNAIREIRKSPDGLLLATYEDNDLEEYEPLKIWDVTTGKEYPFNRAGEPTAGSFNSDGSSFWVGYMNGTIVKHNLTDGEWNSSTVNALKPLAKVQFFGNTGRVGISSTQAAYEFYVFDSRKIDLSNRYSAGKDVLNSSPNGEYALSPAYSENDDGSQKKQLACWQLSTEKLINVFNEQAIDNLWLADNTFIVWTEKTVFHYNPSNSDKEQFIGARYTAPGPILWVKPAPDGKAILVSFQDPKSQKFFVQQVSIPEGALQAALSTEEPTEPSSWAVSSSQPLLFVTDRYTFAFDHQTGEQVWELKNQYLQTVTNLYSQDNSVIYSISTSTFRQLDPKSGEIVRSTDFDSVGDTTINSVQFSSDLNILTFALYNQVLFFDLKTTQLLRTINRPGAISNVNFIAGQKRVLITDSLEQISIWNTDEIIQSANPEPIGFFVVMNDLTNGVPSWLVMDRDGRYDASDPSNVTGASYVMEWEGGLEPINVSQLKSLYYEPGLFAKLTGYDSSTVRPVPDRNALKLFPQIVIEKSTRDPNRVNITLTERDGGGVGKTEILLNGKLVQTSEKSGYISLKVSDFQQYLLPASQLPEGKGNQLSVVAYNSKGDLASQPYSIDVGVPEGLKTPEVNIHALFVGVGDYVGNRRDLTAPPYDAQALQNAIEKSAERLLPGRVHVTTLTTQSAKSNPDNANPNRENILKWFAETSAIATSSDIILVFFAGHGTSQIGDRAGYFFLTSGADPSDINKSILDVHTISGDDLKSNLAKIPAAKQVIILDTCHSGAAASSLVQDRSVSSDYVRAYESIRESSGTWLLAGAAADQLSYESRAVDHGLLTYSLLEAVDQVAPEALRGTPSGEYFLDVERWLSYAAARVESLRNEVGVVGVQKPELKRSNSNQSFDIGVTRPQFRGEIALTPPKPIVLMGTFDNEGEDSLGLENAISNGLQSATEFKLWNNVSRHPRVFRITGRYTTEGATLKVTLFLQFINADQELKRLQTIEFSGPVNDIQGMVEQIRKRVATEITKAKT